MSKHIGIVACSVEGAALCYRTIGVEGAEVMGRHAHPEISMHTYPLSEYMRFIEAGDWQGVANLMLGSVEKLAKIGADFAISPDNTIHQAWDWVQEKSPLPWLHIAEVVALEAQRNGYQQPGVLGTRFLMEGPVYSEVLTTHGLRNRIPAKKDRERINQIIFNELVYCRFLQTSRAYFVQVISELAAGGCDAVILGCTEIPLIVTADISPLPVLDSTRLLARAALREATSTE